MRRIVTWALSTVTVLVLLFSYHTSTSSAVAPSEQVSAAGTGTTAAGGGTGSIPSGPSGSGPTSGSGSSSRSAPSGSAQSGATTVAGDAVSSRFGPVQVQITVSGGKITGADVLQVPDRDRRSEMINSRAVPILNKEAVSVQRAKIDAVSGATITSNAYAQSLQSAIDQAHL